MADMPYEREHFTYVCPRHGSVNDTVCCVPVRIQGRETLLAVTRGSIKLESLAELGRDPRESVTSIECADEKCQSVFHRPQNAPLGLRTEVLAWRRGWTPVRHPDDPLDPGPMYCAWGHKE